MESESHLQRLAKQLTPKSEAQLRTKEQMLRSIAGSPVLLDARNALTPSKTTKLGVWERITQSIAAPASEALLQKVQNLLSPSMQMRRNLSGHVLSKLNTQTTELPYSRTRWIASFAVVLILIQASPALFLAPKSVADSKVLLIPTIGEVSVLVGDLWQPVTEEMTLVSGMRVRTYEGQASILYHDDAVIRFDSNTSVSVHDVSGILEKDSAPQISLDEGHIWVQGLIPSSNQGMHIAVRSSNVFIQEGSVSIADTTEGIAVKVWDRSARIVQNEEETVLSVGEQVVLRGDNPLLVKKIASSQFSTEWPKQNLAKDAVHRRYIAHLQHERRVAAAGILPTSTLYPAKRIAEKVDVLLTFTEESRMEKRLQYAHTRLNEAAALLEDGDEAAHAALEDYRRTVTAIVAGSGSDSVTQSLVEKSLADTVAEVTALLPEDESYSLKKVVLETTADMPREIAQKNQIRQSLFADAITTLHAALDAQDDVAIHVFWEDIQPYLGLLDTNESSLDAQARKEMNLLLMRFANALEDEATVATTLPTEIREDILSYLPQQKKAVTLMSEEEIQATVQAMLERIYLYSMPQSRQNQIHLEMLALEGHNEQGRLLRALFYALPEESSLREKTRREIVRLRWEKAGERIANDELHEAATETGTTL